jgi:putative membrane protein
VIRGALAGALAGFIAAWAMESFQAAWTNAGKQWARQRVLIREGAGRRRGAKGGPEDPARIDLPPDGEPAEEPSTVKVASAIAEPVLDRELTDEEKPVAGELVHYGFGGFNGALYGALADIPLLPVRAFNGMLFGATLWLVADEVMLWKLGLTRKPSAYPSTTHVYALASHLVYGLTLETVRRAIRWLA